MMFRYLIKVTPEVQHVIGDLIRGRYAVNDKDLFDTLLSNIEYVSVQ